MVAPIGSGVAGLLTGAQEALTRLKARPKTEAEQNLAAILKNLKTAPREQAIEAARAKVASIQTRIGAMKLAAGSAAARGDTRASHSLAKEIRDLARNLRGSLDGIGRGAGDLDAATRATLDAAAASVKSEIAGVVETMKDVLKQARLSLLNLFAEPRDRRRAADMFRQAESALEGLRGAAQNPTIAAKV